MPYYCTTAHVKDFVKHDYEELGYVSDGAFSTAIELIIGRAQIIIDDYTRRQFFQVEDAEEVFDGQYQQRYFPKHTPIIDVSSLEYRGSKTDSWSTVSSDDYYIYDEYVFYEDRFTLGFQNYQLTYDYGYTTVPKAIEDAAILLCSNILTQTRINKLGNVMPGGEVQIHAPSQEVLTDEVKQILNPYVRTVARFI